jgi:hypothetical protein
MANITVRRLRFGAALGVLVVVVVLVLVIMLNGGATKRAEWCDRGLQPAVSRLDGKCWQADGTWR